MADRVAKSFWRWLQRAGQLALKLWTLGHLILGTSGALIALEGTANSNLQRPSSADIRREYFTDIQSVDPSIFVDMIHFSDFNAFGESLKGYSSNTCLVTHKTAEKLKLVSDSLKSIPPMAHPESMASASSKSLLESLLSQVQQWSLTRVQPSQRRYQLLLRDCYRPLKSQKHIEEWTQTEDESMKLHFFPDLDKRVLKKLGYAASDLGHSRGSSIDATIVLVTPKGPDGEIKVEALDMGSKVHFFGVQAHTMSPLISMEARSNRQLLQDILRPHFENYRREWWHFTLKGETFSGVGFDFDVEP